MEMHTDRQSKRKKGAVAVSCPHRQTVKEKERSSGCVLSFCESLEYWGGGEGGGQTSFMSHWKTGGEVGGFGDRHTDRKKH